MVLRCAKAGGAHRIREKAARTVRINLQNIIFLEQTPRPNK